MTLPQPELRTIVKELLEPYPDIIRLNPDPAAHHLKIVDGVIWIRPRDRTGIIHEVGHFLTRDPALYFALDVPRVKYGFRRPIEFNGGMQMMRNELCVFAINDVLWEHFAGRTFEDGSGVADARVRFLHKFIETNYPAVQIDRMNCVDRSELHKFYRSWLHEPDNLLSFWEETLNTLRRMVRAARARTA